MRLFFIFINVYNIIFEFLLTYPHFTFIINSNLYNVYRMRYKNMSALYRGGYEGGIDMYKKLRDLPAPQGLYDPAFEHDACGIGFVVNMKGKNPMIS